MPIRSAIEIHVVDRNGGALPQRAAQGNPFVDNPAVALDALERASEFFGRRHHIVDQPDFTQIKTSCEVKSKQVIAQRCGRQIQNLDLGLRLQACRRIIDGFNRQASSGENPRNILIPLAKPRARKTRDPTGGAWHGAKASRSGSNHERRSLRVWANAGWSRRRAASSRSDRFSIARLLGGGHAATLI